MVTLVLGGSGQLGQHLKGEDTILTYNHNPTEGVRLSMDDWVEVEDLIIKLRPSVVINAAAYTDVDGCESERGKCMRVNGEAVRHVARACRVVKSFLVQVSTDYVFDGQKGYYREEDEPNPINYYGLSKLIGESYALSHDLSLVVRTSGVFSAKKPNFPAVVMEKLSKGEEVVGAETFYSPIHAAQLASAIKELVRLRRTGIIHVAGPRISRYELALMIARKLGIDTSLVRKDSPNFSARRPKDSSLDSKRASGKLKTSLSLDLGIEKLARGE